MMLVNILVLLAALLSFSVLIAANDDARRRVEIVMLPMRDGVKLHTVIVYPRGLSDGDKATAVMDRSPYGSTGIELLNDILVPFGFIAIGQDMRGTGQSEGNFTIWHSDTNDSEDLGNWIVQQPWSNGQVFTFGASADGIAAFQTPYNQPPWLKAQYYIWTTAIAFDIIYPNGVYSEALADMWIESVVPDQAESCLDIIKENERYDEWWSVLEFTGKYYKVNYPSAFWAGWYDIFLMGDLAAYNGFNTLSDPSVQYTSKLVIDPLGHCQSAAEFFTEDLVAGRSALAISQMLEVFGVRPVYRPNIKNVTFYVMSSNDDAGKNAGQYWTSVEKFPIPEMQPWYLHGDGSISTRRPVFGEKESSTFTYDPANPVPSMGGNNLAIPCGPLDQSEIDKRSDVVIFNTPVLSDELVMTGPLFATLHVSSDAIDTDFMVRISDVYPTGEARLLQDSGIRMRWREGGNTPVYMQSKEVYEVTMTLWNTSYVLAPGHQLRVAVTSSNSPRFNVNRNNGILLKDQTPEDATIVAKNTIYHSAKYSSYVSLPIVRKRSLPVVHDIREQVAKAFPTLEWDRIHKEYPVYMNNMAERARSARRERK